MGHHRSLYIGYFKENLKIHTGVPPLLSFPPMPSPAFISLSPFGLRRRVAATSPLRQPTTTLLVVPRYRLSTYGRRAFAVAGPSVWNSA